MHLRAIISYVWGICTCPCVCEEYMCTVVYMYVKGRTQCYGSSSNTFCLLRQGLSLSQDLQLTTSAIH